jgi:acyl-CoA dehydrogenase
VKKLDAGRYVVSLVSSHEDRLLLETVQAFMKAEIHPHEDLVDKLGEVPLDLGRKIEARAREAGLHAANLPEEVGGGGLSLKAKTMMEREYGKTSHALHSWVAWPTELLLACEGDQKERYLYPCVRGEKRELFALTEPEAGSDVMGMKSHARRDGADWILNGSKHFISGPVMSDFAIVFAATGIDETPRGTRKRVTAFFVDVGTPGFDIRDGTHCVSYRGYKTFQLAFDNVRLGPGQILGEEGSGLEMSGKWLAYGRISVGASCCGKAERLLGLATEWAASRKQFGQAIGKVQGTGFKLADMATELRAADLLAEDAIRHANDGILTDADISMVKL